ncbi:3-deoxy-D-manno-octulosonic acid transferase [Helicobacter didelphidarum]|uniref:3-deoxy-D-manno-octulosonic acid transferase n=1 Tax=Helicobacter didelphidarum TaxID=2040648 RepID=A0A3D8IIX9_9HELI|nr:3-deoxy-D-manno-octulosonic acid transferase [Helicobacter didelphidarum]RDU64905.1 3-deoxy-D-manno-octulosonic acid transferase [Helicobacter didelphidarum]
MIFIYYGLMCLAHIICTPLLLLLICKQKYRQSIPYRFFFPKNYSKKKFEIWIHACSFGEISSLQTLIQSIPNQKKIFLSVITQTGFAQAHKLYGNMSNLTISYLPFETLLPFFAPKCEKLFVLEAELWLMLFAYAKRNQAQVKLINARISTRSFGRYLKLKFFYNYLFNFVDITLAQSNDDKMRLESLGAQHISIMGNIKATNPIMTTKHYKKPQRLIIVAASTHANEEECILESFKTLQHYWANQDSHTQCNDSFDLSANNKKYNCNTNYLHNKTKSEHIAKDSNGALFIIVPRHPERFDEVYMLCCNYFKTLRLSHITNQSFINFDNLDCELLLIDTMGELINLYAISDIVILGGAYAKVGGHNPLEVAAFHNILLSGKEIFNQRTLFECIENYYLSECREIGTILKQYKQLHIAKISSTNNDMIKEILA